MISSRCVALFSGYILEQILSVIQITNNAKINARGNIKHICVYSSLRFLLFFHLFDIVVVKRFSLMIRNQYYLCQIAYVIQKILGNLE